MSIFAKFFKKNANKCSNNDGDCFLNKMLSLTDKTQRTFKMKNSDIIQFAKDRYNDMLEVIVSPVCHTCIGNMQEVCFKRLLDNKIVAYGYETPKNGIIYLCRLHFETVENLKKVHPLIFESEYPKGANEDLYAIILDDSFDTDSIKDILEYVGHY